MEPDRPFKLGDKLNNTKANRKGRNHPPKQPTAPAEEDALNGGDEEAAMNAMNGTNGTANGHGVIDGESEAMDVPLRPEEKRRLPFEDGLYLAPLTTVGNLVRISSAQSSLP